MNQIPHNTYTVCTVNTCSQNSLYSLKNIPTYVHLYIGRYVYKYVQKVYTNFYLHTYKPYYIPPHSILYTLITRHVCTYVYAYPHMCTTCTLHLTHTALRLYTTGSVTYVPTYVGTQLHVLTESTVKVIVVALQSLCGVFFLKSHLQELFDLSVRRNLTMYKQ